MFLDGQTQGDGTSVGKCPNSLKCLSTGECRVCKLINNVYEGCSGATPYCDESSDPPSCTNGMYFWNWLALYIFVTTIIIQYALALWENCMTGKVIY